MSKDSNIQIHFVNAETNEMVLRKLVSHVPRFGDEIRFGGPGQEKYYKVVHVVWVYDEPDVPVDRVNVGVISCA